MNRLLAAAFLFPALAAVAASRPVRAAADRDDVRESDRKSPADESRDSRRLDAPGGSKGLGDLRGETASHDASARILAARSMLETFKVDGRSAGSARVVSYAFGVEAGKLGGRKTQGRPLDADARAAIDQISPRRTAELLKRDGLGRDGAVAVLNRIERLKTDPSFLAEGGAKLKVVAADRDQGLSESQLARNEELADEVYGR